MCCKKQISQESLRMEDIEKSELLPCSAPNVYFYLLIDHRELTSWNRVLFEQATGLPTSKEIPLFYVTRLEFHYRIHNSPPPIPILSQINPVYVLHPKSWNIYLSIVLPPQSGFQKWPLSLRFPHQRPVCISPDTRTCHMPHPSHSS